MKFAGRPAANGFLATLPGPAAARMASSLTPVTLEPGQILHSPGEAGDYVYLPSEGMIALMMAVIGGRTVATGIVGRDDILGATAITPTRAVVRIGGVAARIRMTDFRKAAREAPAIRDLLVRHTEAMLRHTQITAACNSLHPIRNRMLRLILQTRDCIDDDEIPLTQEIISEMLGVRRGSISDDASRLKADGLIDYSRGLITIINRKRLEAAACGCLRRRIDWRCGDWYGHQCAVLRSP